MISMLKGAVVGKSTPPPVVGIVTNMSYALIVFFHVYSTFFQIFHTPPLNLIQRNILFVLTFILFIPNYHYPAYKLLETFMLLKVTIY